MMQVQRNDSPDFAEPVTEKAVPVFPRFPNPVVDAISVSLPEADSCSAIYMRYDIFCSELTATLA